MPVVLAAEQTITVGEIVIIDANAPGDMYGVVFEDDGQTGYFYALELSKPKNRIVDSLHIYNVSDVGDRDLPSKLRIGWSTDGLKSILDINGTPHAVFDFVAKRGYCRTGYPAPIGDWSEAGDHTWDDSVLKLFE